MPNNAPWPTAWPRASAGTISTRPIAAVGDIGPGGHYLGHPHTLENFQRAFFMPELFDNNSIEQWQAEGAVETTERALKYTRDLLASLRRAETGRGRERGAAGLHRPARTGNSGGGRAQSGSLTDADRRDPYLRSTTCRSRMAPTPWPMHRCGRWIPRWCAWSRTPGWRAGAKRARSGRPMPRRMPRARARRYDGNGARADRRGEVRH